jgi:hypothetical protein
MSKIYFYKLTCDDGGAPCVEGEVLSLAICKPMIRNMAEPGDLIFGFAANSLFRDNRVIYVARITKKESDGTYYRERVYSRRADCVYRWRGGRFVWKRGARYHRPEDLAHDLGSPPAYERANVILSADFRYYGGSGSADYKIRYRHVMKAVEDLGQGHRVNHGAGLVQELLELADEAFTSTPQKVLGKPTTAPRPGVSHRTRSCAVIDMNSSD